MAVVEYEKQGHIVIIKMNRPERLNAQGYDLVLGLAQAWCRYRDDADAWIAILTGVGRAFCAGLDVKEHAERGGGPLAVPPIPIRDPYWEEELDKPTIAAVNGFALGGGFFMTTRADFRIASEKAYFQITEVPRGGIAGFHVQVWENLPYAVAAELAVGQPMTAQRAYQIGFVNKVVPEDQVMPEALKLADDILTRPPLVIHQNLRLLRMIRRANSMVPSRVFYDMEYYKKSLALTEDAKEAIQSFVEKRKPVFKGR
jgi:enoyl-CoA hydratase/carnithine racemase